MPRINEVRFQRPKASYTIAFDAFARDRNAQTPSDVRGNSVLLVTSRPKIEKFLVVLVCAAKAQTRTTRNDIKWNARLPTVRSPIRSAFPRSNSITFSNVECLLQMMEEIRDAFLARPRTSFVLFASVVFELLGRRERGVQLCQRHDPNTGCVPATDAR